MMEIRAKCRRFASPPTSLVVIDYLQLMSSGRKVESRQQEVSEFSVLDSCWPRSWRCRWWPSASSTKRPEQCQGQEADGPTCASPADRAGRGYRDPAAPRGRLRA